MKLYQLMVSGPYQCFGGNGKFYSGKIFRTAEDAEKYLPTFTASVCSNDRFDNIERVTKHVVIELEIDDDSIPV